MRCYGKYDLTVNNTTFLFTEKVTIQVDFSTVVDYAIIKIEFCDDFDNKEISTIHINQFKFQKIKEIELSKEILIKHIIEKYLNHYGSYQYKHFLIKVYFSFENGLSFRFENRNLKEDDFIFNFDHLELW